MACEVVRCQTPVFNSYRSYIKHWKKIHVQFIDIFACDVCSSTFNRRCALTRHLRMVHKFNGTELVSKITNISVDKIQNVNYIAPGDVYPRKKV